MIIRKLTSLTMLLSFILILCTSIILYTVPHGQMSHWIDWHLLGFIKMNQLQQNNVCFTNSDQNSVELIKNDDLSPKELIRINRTPDNKDTASKLFTNIPRLGDVNQTLWSICITYKLSCSATIKYLKTIGVKAVPAQTIEEIALTNQVDPQDFIEILHALEMQ